MRARAAELIQLRVDVLVLTATAIHFVRDMTVDVPTVFVIADDPELLARADRLIQ